MKNFRLGHTDTINAYAFDSQGNLISSCYDSGFGCISQVYRALRDSHNRTSHNEIKEMNIVCDDKNASVWYRVYGQTELRFKKL